MNLLSATHDPQRIRPKIASPLVCVPALLGLIPVALQLYFVVLPYGFFESYENWRNGLDSYPISLFHSWIGMTLYSPFSLALYLVVPFLVSIPCLRKLPSNEGRKPHAQLIESFSQGAAIVSFPQAISILATSLCLPAITPDATSGTFPISRLSFLGDVFYSNPYLYLFLYVGFDAIIGGFLASSAMCCRLIAPRYKAVAFLPAIINTVWCIAAQPPLKGYAPSYVMMPGQPFFIDHLFALLLLLAAAFLLTILTVFVISAKAKHRAKKRVNQSQTAA